MDNITLNRINLLHPKIKEEVKKIIEECNSKLTQHSQIRIVQGYRTFSEQHKLFLQRPKVTNADAGQSYHNYGLAIDFCLSLYCFFDVEESRDSKATTCVGRIANETSINIRKSLNIFIYLVAFLDQ